MACRGKTVEQAELVIASVPWRLKGLNVALKAAREQGIKHVVLVLDRYTKEDETRINLQGFESLKVKRLSENSLYRGNWYRFFLLCGSSFPFVVLLDDDVIPQEGYFVQLLDSLLETNADCVGTEGMTPEGDWVFHTTILNQHPLAYVQVSNIACRTESVKALVRDREFLDTCRKHFLRLEDDELIFACWMWNNNKIILKVHCPITFDVNLRDDSRSLWKRVNFDLKFFLQRREKFCREMQWFFPIPNHLGLPSDENITVSPDKLIR